MMFLIVLLFSIAQGSEPSEFLAKIENLPRTGQFKNCAINISEERKEGFVLLHVYLRDTKRGVDGYSLFPLGQSAGVDKIRVTQKRAFVRMVNDVQVPRFYEDFVVEWDERGQLEFMGLRKFKSYGIYWDFEFNIKCGVSDITI